MSTKHADTRWRPKPFMARDRVEYLPEGDRKSAVGTIVKALYPTRSCWVQRGPWLATSPEPELIPMAHIVRVLGRN